MENKTLHYIAICTAILACATMSVAYAQVETEPAKTWDPEIQRIINQLISVAFLVATGVLSLAGMAIRSYFSQKGILAVEQTRDVKQSYFNQAVLLALAFYETIKRKKNNGGAVDWTTVTLVDPDLNEAALWMMKAWPEATEKMTLDDVLHSLLARVPSGVMTDRAQELATAKAAGTVVVKPA